jgi:hypothetical protein
LPKDVVSSLAFTEYGCIIKLVSAVVMLSNKQLKCKGEC